MLLGIIKDQTNNIEYYIDSENKDKYYEISVTKVTNNTSQLLSKEEIRSLLKTIFSSKLTYKEKYNDYDVYLDEANNKRYFKNGIENLFMFIENNGIDAISCFEKIDKKPRSKAIKMITSTIVLEMIISSIALIPLAGDVQIRTGIDTAISAINTLETDEIINTINSSKYLSEEDKETLCNEAYFNFVLEYSGPMRYYAIRKNIEELRIVPYEDNRVKNADGYVDPLHPSVIYVSEKNMNDKKYYKHIITHEFIHLTQANSYSYLREACDEIAFIEFYNSPIVAYQDQIKRAKTLMEIIGPEPVIEYVYNGDVKKFAAAVQKYLTPEETNQLLNLFNLPSTSIVDPNSDIQIRNKAIDSYLAKMYYNKTGKNMSDDAMINKIYENGATLRYYFNNQNPTYNSDFVISSEKVLIEKVDMSEIANSDKVERFEYTLREEDKDGKLKLKSKETKDFSTIPFDDINQINVKYKDNTIGYIQKTKDGWGQVNHYKIEKQYEPSIAKKFPNQVRDFSKGQNKELQIMIDEGINYEVNESEAKLM